MNGLLDEIDKTDNFLVDNSTSAYHRDKLMKFLTKRYRHVNRKSVLSNSDMNTNIYFSFRNLFTNYNKIGKQPSRDRMQQKDLKLNILQIFFTGRSNISANIRFSYFSEGEGETRVGFLIIKLSL